jgi:hypothetical protein
VSVPLDFAPLTGSDIRVTITGIRPAVTTEYQDLVPITMPVAIAEAGIPGVQRAPLPAELPSTCRTDLLTVDGHPVALRLTGSPASAQALDAVDAELCDPASPAGPPPTLALGAGDHVVRSTPGTASGIDVDGLVLGSDAGGAPMAIGAGGTLPASATAVPVAARAATPKVTVTDNGRTKIQVHVTGAQPGTPFWLVLGQSNNAGWQATVAGKDVGGSTLVNGFANGWLVKPRTESFDVTLKWTPQNRVWIALVISAAALILCLFLALRRRRSRATDDIESAAAAIDAEPVLASPLVATGDRPPLSLLIGGPVIAGVVGGVLVRGWVGAVAAICVLAVLLRPRLRPLLTIGAPAALALSGLFVIGQQYRNSFFSTFDWPSNFERVNEIAWLAIILLAADVLVELIRDRRREAAPEDAPVRAP